MTFSYALYKHVASEQDHMPGLGVSYSLVQERPVCEGLQDEAEHSGP